MTVARLRDEMTHHEFVYWQMYHARRAQEMEMANKKGGHG